MGEVPGIYSRYLVGIYSIRYTCMKAYNSVDEFLC
nr:MAG TPA: hypothetical protein [Bacteriophage sp.]